MKTIKGRIQKWTKSIAQEHTAKVPDATADQVPPEPNNDPRLCSLCSGISMQKLLGGYKHHPDYQALEKSSKTCPLCSILFKTIHVKDQLSQPIPEDDILGRDSAISLDATRFPLDDGWILSLYLQCGGRAKELSLTVPQDSRNSAQESIDIRADSDKNFEWLTRTLNQCLNEHAGCTSGDPAVKPLQEIPQRMPTRVIDVGPGDGSEAVKVIETGRRPDRYVALSHCWGKQQIITTTTKNIDKHKVAIEFTELSKTFQDAVTATRKVGMRYLWIDSLCILQDDGDDWAKEASYMGDIYRTATFTIAAAGAEAGAIGCFIPRTPDALQPVRIQYISKAGDLEVLQIGLSKGNFQEDMERGPLQSRAWCLQERILSRRTIHFCKEQIIWECEMATIVEDGTPIDGPSAMEAHQLKLEDKVGTAGHYLNPLQKRWRSIVEDYSKRDITKGTDKLPAISGVAQKIQPVTKDKYLAGLWLNHLHNDLFWFALDDMKPVVPYRAPTWSWAAYDGEISYNTVFDMKTIYFNSSMQNVDGECKSSTANVLGEVSHGYIQLSARMRKAVLSTQESPQDSRVAKNTRELFEHESRGLDSSDSPLGQGALDSVSSVEREVICLNIATKAQSPGPWHQALLIEETCAKSGEYRRVGAAIIRPKEWFDKQPYELITLV